ncbi:hypothetical protein [Fontivita pretiosa]|uniref:hypothetical protein n=1 Tax=Fontivita pretiosa TaxID=2989684 RepID=UPI003D167CE7
METRRLLATWYVSDSSLYSGGPYSTPLPNDSTDDYAAINWLLHTRNPRPQAGDTVQFSEPDGDTGEYIFAYTNPLLVLPADITYTGANAPDGTNDTIINQPIPGTPSLGHAVWRLDNNDPNDVTITNFVFEHEGIWLVSDTVTGVTADNIAVTGNWFRNMGRTGGQHYNMLFNTAGDFVGSDGQNPSLLIADNKFENIHGDNGIYLESGRKYKYVMIEDNTFVDVNEGMHILLQHGEAGSIVGVVVRRNTISHVRRMGIEIQGNRSVDLTVEYNKVRDFYERDDSTFGISVVPGGANVTGTLIQYNEVSATRTPDGEEGNSSGDPSQEVRRGIEVAGGTSAGNNCKVQFNTVHGVWSAIVLHTSLDLKVDGNHIWNWEYNDADGIEISTGANSPDIGTEVANDSQREFAGVGMAAGDLIIGGGSSVDTIQLIVSGSGVNVTKNGVAGPSNPHSPSGQIIAYGYNGNDTFEVTGVLQQGVLEGGSGTDTLTFKPASGDNTARTYAVDTYNFTFQSATTASWIDTRLTASGLGGAILRSGEGITLDTGNGADTITGGNSDAAFNVSPVAVTLLDSSGDDTVSVNNDNSHTASLFFGETQRIGSLTIRTGGTATLATGADKVLTVTGLTISGTGALDLNDNDLIVKNGSLSSITALLKTGFENSGGDEWLGSGIRSTEAEADNDTAQSILYGLGVILNDLSQVGGSGPVYSTFAGQSVGVTDILVKFTYMGDADLNGVVDATDYSQIDNGYVNGLGDWINGDFDYAAPINATDYALIDNAFVNQGDPLRAGSGSQDVLSSMAAELFGKMADEYDLGTPQEMIARHSKLFGQAYDDALAKVQGGNRP